MVTEGKDAILLFPTFREYLDSGFTMFLYTKSPLVKIFSFGFNKYYMLDDDCKHLGSSFVGQYDRSLNHK